jgi:DnaK suppressor protein
LCLQKGKLNHASEAPYKAKPALPRRGGGAEVSLLHRTTILLSLSQSLVISRRARALCDSGLREYTQMQLSKGKNRRTPDKPQKNGKSGAAGLAAGLAAGFAAGLAKGLAAGLATGLGPDAKPYRPSDKEPFMNERQREYFRLKLLDWREDILKEAKETLQHLQDESQNHPDLADRASSETDRAIELRARDRQRKLIAKIDAALQRIEDGTYGYCEETGEPITLKRLEARPIATLSIEAQERHERRERVYRDD